MSYLFRFKRSIKNTVKEVGLGFVGFTVAGLGALYFDAHVGGIRPVEGPSMCPTLNPLEYSEEKFEDKSPDFVSRDSVSKIDYVYLTRKFSPQRGDVVVLDDPKSPNNYLIKRIIALPGDTIVPLGVNRVERDPVRLSDKEVWVESDAFGYKDSNLFGPVKVEAVQGKVLCAAKGIFYLTLQTFRWIPSELSDDAKRRLKVGNRHVQTVPVESS